MAVAELSRLLGSFDGLRFEAGQREFRYGQAFRADVQRQATPDMGSALLAIGMC